jgi:hypothetical protein
MLGGGEGEGGGSGGGDEGGGGGGDGRSVPLQRIMGRPLGTPCQIMIGDQGW